MAAKACIIANPTGADVTVNSKVALARRLTKLSLDDATIADWPGWVTAGCVILGQDAAGAANSMERREIAGFLIEGEEQDTA